MSGRENLDFVNKYWHAEFRADFAIRHHNRRLVKFQAKKAVNLKLNHISLAQMNKKFEEFAKINFTTNSISMNSHKPTFDFTGSERVEMLLRIHRFRLHHFSHASSSDIAGDLMD